MMSVTCFVGGETEISSDAWSRTVDLAPRARFQTSLSAFTPDWSERTRFGRFLGNDDSGLRPRRCR